MGSMCMRPARTPSGNKYPAVTQRQGRGSGASSTSDSAQVQNRLVVSIRLSDQPEPFFFTEHAQPEEPFFTAQSQQQPPQQQGSGGFTTGARSRTQSRRDMSLSNVGEEARHSNLSTGSSTTTTNNMGERKSNLSMINQEVRTRSLKHVLSVKSLRLELRDYLAKTYAEESVEFYDAVYAMQSMNEVDQAVQARRIVERFVLDDAPKQVLLSAETHHQLVEAYKKRQPLYLKPAMDELFHDIKTSNGFESFLQQNVPLQLPPTPHHHHPVVTIDVTA